MEKYYISTNQISESYDGYKHNYPKYDKSTTDPTYYEPAATRIANMKKSAGAILEGIYDYYSKDDVSKFNENNFKNNISNAYVDPRFNTKLLREEVSQVVNNVDSKVQDMIDDKEKSLKSKKERISETVEASKIISANNTENTDSE